MKTTSSHHMSAPPICPALQHLVQEHNALRNTLRELIQAAAAIQKDCDTSYYTALLILHKKTQHFYTLFSLHAQKEELYMLPLLSKYLRSEAGPVAVIQFEHEQLRFHLATFLNHTKQIDEQVPTAEAKGLTYHLIEIAAILYGHFDKEENMLYLLAERLLSDKEKDELFRQLTSTSEAVRPMPYS